MVDPTMGGMPPPDPSQTGGGWHGAGAARGWFGNQQFEIDPRTGMPKAPRGYSRTTKPWSRKGKPKTRIKRWARRNAKAQWRLAKKDVRRVKRDTLKKWGKKPATKRDPGSRWDLKSYQDMDNRKRKTQPPPDGTTASCRNCGYQIQYSTDRGRWEHTGKGNASCFGK